jgi:hypothetical protein
MTSSLPFWLLTSSSWPATIAAFSTVGAVDCAAADDATLEDAFADVGAEVVALAHAVSASAATPSTAVARMDVRM